MPVDVVLAPAWWYQNEGITFREDFFFDAARRVEAERRMEEVVVDDVQLGIGKYHCQHRCDHQQNADR